VKICYERQFFFLSFIDREKWNDVKTFVSAHTIHKIVDLVTLVVCY